MSNLKPGRGADQFPLRLPEGMRERIKESAEASGRSMNAEIVARLELTFRDENSRESRWSIPFDEADKEAKRIAAAVAKGIARARESGLEITVQIHADMSNRTSRKRQDKSE